MTPTTELVTAKQVAAWTGLHLSTVYRLIEDGRIDVVRFGRAVRIPIESYRRYVAEHTTAAAS